jgi:hypothetical protein
LGEHLHGVGASGGDEDSGFAVGVGEVRDDDGAALPVGAVGPVAEVGVHRTAELGLVRSVAAPRHHRLRQPPQDEVPERVLAVLLSDVGEVAAAVDDTAAAPACAGTTGPVLGVGEQRTPLRLQQVDDPQVLPELFQLRTGGGEEVDVGVAGPPAAGSHVGGAVEAEGEVALAGFDSHGLAQWCVLEPTRHVDHHVSAW